MVRLLSKHSNYLFLGIIFYHHCKLDCLSDYLDTYYKCLALTFDILALVKDVR